MNPDLGDIKVYARRVFSALSKALTLFEVHDIWSKAKVYSIPVRDYKSERVVRETFWNVVLGLPRVKSELSSVQHGTRLSYLDLEYLAGQINYAHFLPVVYIENSQNPKNSQAVKDYLASIYPRTIMGGTCSTEVAGLRDIEASDVALDYFKSSGKKGHAGQDGVPSQAIPIKLPEEGGPNKISPKDRSAISISG